MRPSGSASGVLREIRDRCFRYPGMDIPAPSWHSWHLGTRVRGPSWLTLLGQPVLGGLGGRAPPSRKFDFPPEDMLRWERRFLD